MNKLSSHTCAYCGASLLPTSRYCPVCGQPIALQLDRDVVLSGGKHLHLSQEMLSLRDLLAVVESGVAWWQQQYDQGEAVNRERAATAINDLSRIFTSLSQQLAQGRKTVRITSRLPVQRAYRVGCPVCGRGNRPEARFCIGCGAQLPVDAAASTALLGSNHMLRLHVASRSDVGQVRQNNEDTCLTSTLTTTTGTRVTLLMIADGMGGEHAGEVASRLASEAIQRTLTTTFQHTLPDSDTAWAELLRAALQSANQRVYSEAQAHPDQRGMGTTLTLAVVAHRRLYLAHVGDSRGYLLNAHGVTDDGARLLHLTLDHTLVARLVDIGQLTPEQANTHPYRNMLYRSLGTDPVVDVDTNSQPIESGDIILLCSDGLTIYVSDDELLNIALNYSDPEHICTQLVALANQRGGQDNISVIVAKVEES